MRKRILSVFMVLCLMMAIAPATFATGEETFDTWDGTTSTTPELVGGVYQIDSAADLVGFAALVNGGTFDADAILLTGVDLGGHSFIPIGAYAYKSDMDILGGAFYSGNFNGNSHTIRNGSIGSSNAVYNKGIFGFVNQGGNIHDLNVANITVSGTTSANEDSTGAVIGLMYKATATNLTATDCTVTGVHRVGGVIGSVRDLCTVTNCDNVGTTVTASGMYCGGVVGAAHDMDHNLLTVNGNPATIIDCDNSGTVNGTTETGGIVGYTDQTTITNCDNSGSIIGTGNYGTGGIVGFDAFNPRSVIGIQIYSPNKGATITDCDNFGAINGPRAGGIVGTLGVTPGQDQPGSSRVLTRIIGCSNTGDVSGTAGKCGAIFGYQITYAHGDGSDYIDNLIVRIENCTFDCDVNNVAATTPTSSTFVEIIN